MNYLTSGYVVHPSLYLVIIVLVMGIRHGFDLDHLATIDAITRVVKNDTNVSKLAGFLFSLGHGLIVTLLSIAIGSGVIQFKISNHLEMFGGLVSTIFLIVFGLLNLMTIFKFSESSHKKIIISRFLFDHFIIKNCKPFTIFCIGALFAISFDTFSQITLLSLSAATMGGCFFSLLIGVLFTMGMLLADGLNGLIVSKMIYRADKTSNIVSCGIGLGIAFFSLGIGVFNLANFIT